MPDSNVQKTAFTEVIETSIKLRGDRPGLLFSSTSWTPDEDFSVLMEALQGTGLYITIFSFKLHIE